MRRALLLMALTIAVVWLMKATPREVKGEFRSTTLSSRSSAAPPTPVAIQGCGECDPNQEWACIDQGGSWDPSSCTCSFPGCDPWQEQDCYFSGGTWEGYPWCSCTYECNPGSPQVVGETWVSYEYCDGWEYWYCDGTWTDYEQYCQDGSVYNSWTEYIESCWSAGEPCGDQCEWDPYSCCDYWYCN
jgi:hypothetical protein